MGIVITAILCAVSLILAFVGGVFVGAKLSGKQAGAPEPSQEVLRKLQENQAAFEQMLTYNINDAYGTGVTRE